MSGCVRTGKGKVEYTNVRLGSGDAMTRQVMVMCLCGEVG